MTIDRFNEVKADICGKEEVNYRLVTNLFFAYQWEISAKNFSICDALRDLVAFV